MGEGGARVDKGHIRCIGAKRDNEEATERSGGWWAERGGTRTVRCEGWWGRAGGDRAGQEDGEMGGHVICSVYKQMVGQRLAGSHFD